MEGEQCMRNVAIVAAFALVPIFAADSKGMPDHLKRIDQAAGVLGEIMAAGDQSIPEDLLKRAQCVGVVPNLKRGGFIIGAKYGKGVLTCRVPGSNGWSAPSTIRIEGGNIGFQIGAGETDVVLVVMNQKGVDALMKSKFTVGADAAAMAGPVGRSLSAATDAMMRAEILSYSRSRGVFAGVALDGATLRPDDEDNEKIYGKKVTQHELLTGKVKAPSAAGPLYNILNRYAPVKSN
jgi:lipid-binding SYLF domain-containing protein